MNGPREECHHSPGANQHIKHRKSNYLVICGTCEIHQTMKIQPNILQQSKTKPWKTCGGRDTLQTPGRLSSDLRHPARKIHLELPNQRQVTSMPWMTAAIRNPFAKCCPGATWAYTINPGSKVPFWQFFRSAKMTLLNACMKFKIFFAKRLLLRHYESAIYKKYS